MRRRDFLALLGGTTLSLPSSAFAQSAKVYRLGTLSAGPPLSDKDPRGAILINTLAKRGYSLGQNLIYEARGARGKMSQMPQLMQELKAANVDVVVTISYPAAAAAKASVYRLRRSAPLKSPNQRT